LTAPRGRSELRDSYCQSRTRRSAIIVKENYDWGWILKELTRKVRIGVFSLAGLTWECDICPPDQSLGRSPR
jgi:hypothetical protein